MAVTASAGNLNFTITVTDETKGAIKNIGASVSSSAGAHDNAAESAAEHAAALGAVDASAKKTTSTIGKLWEAFAGAKTVESATEAVEHALEGMGSKTVEAAVGVKVLRAGLVDLGEHFSEATAELGVAGEVLKDFGIKGLIVGAVVLSVGDYIKDAIEDFAAFQAMGVKLNANLASIGQQGKVTAADMEDMGETLSRTTIFNPAQIMQAGVQLSQFANLSRDQIKELTPVILDFAAATGTSAANAAQTLGQALIDPERGAMLLERQLRNVTEAQREQIKLAEEAGDYDKARAILIEDVTARYNGQATALDQGVGPAFMDASKQAGYFFEKLGEDIGGTIVAVTDMTGVFQSFASMWADMSSALPSPTQSASALKEQLYRAQHDTRGGGPDQSLIQSLKSQLAQVQDTGQYGAGASDDTTKILDTANNDATALAPDGNKRAETVAQISDMQKALQILQQQKDQLSKDPVLNSAALASNQSEIGQLTQGLNYAKGAIEAMRDGMAEFGQATQLAVDKASLFGGQAKVFDAQIEAAKDLSKQIKGTEDDCIRCELPHGFGRDYGTTSFWSGSCVALFHIEFPDFWDDQRDIVIGVFQKGGGIGSGSWRSEVWAAEFVGAMQKNWE